MKKMSRVISTLALTLMSLGAVSSANALALKSFSPTFTYDGTPATTGTGLVGIGPANGVGGMPIWFMGADGTAVQPCIVTGCGLVASGTFTVLPVAFPLNFPVEAFYFAAQTPVAGANPATQIGATGIFTDVFAGLEFTTIGVSGLPGVSPIAAGGVVLGTFQRLRVTVDPLATPATGIWTVDHPWGTTTFDAATAKKHGTGVQITIDVPVPTPNDFAATLGFPVTIPQQFSMSTFLKSTAATSPFLGDALTQVTYTGGPVRNFFQVTGPPGTTGPIPTAIITGKTIGMDVQPGVNYNFGATIMGPPTAPPTPPTRTVTITNATANAITFPAIAPVGADLLDFAIVSPSVVVVPGVTGCSASTVAPSAVCSFDITFTPTTAAKAARVATIPLAPTVAVAVPPLSPPPPVTLNLSGTAQVKIATAVAPVVVAPASPHGTITPDATVDPVTGGVNAGSAVTFTVTPSIKKLKVKDVAEGAVLLTPSTIDAAAFTIANVGSVNHTVTANFMQSGDLNEDGVLDVADALVALKIVAGVQAAATDDPTNSAVKVAPLDTAGQPAPLDANPAANPGIGDVLVILRRVLKLDQW